MNFLQLSSYTPSSIATTANTSFTSHYRTLSRQVGGRVYTLFNTAIADFDFLKVVIYNNDYLNIPPVETFLAFYGTSLPCMNDEERKCIGALFGNLFRFVFNYTTVRRKQYSNYIVGSAKYFIL